MTSTHQQHSQHNHTGRYDNRFVTVNVERGELRHARRRTDPRTLNAAYTVPDRRRFGWVIDVILLAMVIALLVAFL